MSALVKHVFLPAIAPAAIYGLWFTPVTLFGCVNRGLMAVGVALISTVAAVVTMKTGVRARARGQSVSIWWVTTFILLLPLFLLAGPLG